MKPLRSIILSGGQGDAMMGAYGLAALQACGKPFLADDATVYARSIAAPLIDALLPDVKTISIEHSAGVAHPRYYTSAETSGSAMLRNWFGQDFYVNFTAPRRQASTGFTAPRGKHALFEKLNEWRLFGSRDWHRVTPTYYGLRMWLPAAAALGLNGVDLLRGLYRTWPVLRERLRAAAKPVPANTPPVAIFPVGKAYQTMPPEFVAALTDGLGPDDYACYFAPGEKFMARYQAAGLRCEVTADVDTVLAVVAGAERVASVDSFVSHLAQIAARDHIAFMSHDLPEHTLHPAVRSRVMFTAMPCVPCNYNMRQHHDACAAGHPVCGVYVDADYLERGRAALRGD